jgi:hypothetical protein
MSTAPDESAPGPIELMESARTKYQLALARLRRGPAELALLSLHGAVEDVLRAHGLRLGLPEAHEPFARLLDGLVAARQQPLSGAEAEGIRRMHRLRARVAHGEQIVVTAETIGAYQRLAARLLPRYGVLVVGPDGDDLPAEAPASTATTVGRRPRDTMSALRSEPAAMVRRGDTARIEREPPQPRRERTVYPEGGSARYLGRAMPSSATADLPLAREWVQRGGDSRGRRGGAADLWARSQSWLLPALAILCIFIIGLVISVSLQQMRAVPPVPTAALPTSAQAEPPPPAPGFVAPTAQAGEGVPAAATAPPPTAGPAPGELAPGRSAYVRADAVALNVRARPGTAGDNPVIFTLAPGTALEVVGGPVEQDGFTWWQVRGPVGEGWCAGQFLEVR